MMSNSLPVVASSLRLLTRLSVVLDMAETIRRMRLEENIGLNVDLQRYRGCVSENEMTS